MNEATFTQVVTNVLETMPLEFRPYLQQVDILIADRPDRAHRRVAGIKPWQTLYGLYEGVPLTERSSDSLFLPDTITIFRLPLVRDFPRRDELHDQIRQTVLHEIAHVFGLSDERLRELGAY
jgi:predicted Zn-dependent protease with MMP-like domain